MSGFEGLTVPNYTVTVPYYRGPDSARAQGGVPQPPPLPATLVVVFRSSGSLHRSGLDVSGASSMGVQVSRAECARRRYALVATVGFDSWSGRARAVVTVRRRKSKTSREVELAPGSFVVLEYRRGRLEPAGSVCG